MVLTCVYLTWQRAVAGTDTCRLAGCLAVAWLSMPLIVHADDSGLTTDCSRLPIVGDGFGGAYLSCEERLSLYASFRCIPDRKEEIEASCPDWEGLKADIDWEAVDRLIDEREDEAKRKSLELAALVERIHEAQHDASSQPAAEAEEAKAP